jgi:HD-like signal output (HDOD) protein
VGTAPSKDDALAACVERLSGRGELPAFAEQIQEVLAASGAEQLSLGSLSGTVLKNLSLTTRVLKTANSALFRRTGDTVLSVSRAIALLGWNTIRDIAASTLLFEHFRSRGAPVRELILLSLLTANHARAVARHAGYPREEEAYLCGMFRGLGEILAACHLPREYREITARMHAQGWAPREASLSVLSFSFDDLGRAMAARWRLGGRVTSCVVRPGLVNPRPAGEADRLVLIVAFSHELTTLAYRVGGEAGREDVRQLVKSWGSGLALTDDVVARVLAEGRDDTREAFESAGVTEASFRPLWPRSRRRGPGTGREPATGVDLDELPDAPELALPGAERLARLTAEVASAIASNGRIPRHDTALMVLEAVHRGTGCDRALLCVVDRDEGVLQARLGVGPGAAELVPRFRFPISPLMAPVSQVALQREDVFVEEVPQSRYAGSRFAVVVKACSFALLPLVVGEAVAGALYLDRLDEPLGLDAHMRRSILALRDCGSTALRRLSGI